MKLEFHIEYRTNWGEEVRIIGDAPELGGGCPEQALALSTVDGVTWTRQIDVATPPSGSVCYNYHIYKDGQMTRSEWQAFPRRLFVSTRLPEQKYLLLDNWKNLPDDAFFYTSAFTDALLARQGKQAPPPAYNRSVVIKAYAPRVAPQYSLAVSGNIEALGNWNPEKALVMTDANFPEWMAAIDADHIDQAVEYKFVLRNNQTGETHNWEANPNRHLPRKLPTEGETLVVADRYVHFGVPAWKGAGVAVPVFSLRSESSFGVGDFADLHKLVDWAVATGQKLIQILPINDTQITGTWTDSYPYNSISIYAFHPIYLSPEKMGRLTKRGAMEAFAEQQATLNALPVLNYEAVMTVKLHYFQEIFAQDGTKTLAGDDFRRFFEANREWLMPYAAFSHLRDKFGTPDFRQWTEHSTFSRTAIEQYCLPSQPHYNRISFYYYLQYHLHLQLLDATRYARQKGVALKGDIPIGISRNSVEAWTEPHYFNLDGQAGAPPDDFSVNGQNWGFPTYNWDVMEADGYAWWIKRFRKMAEYFDAYRIDHILGFFRIWQIPLDAVHGLLGQFSPALPMSADEIRNYGMPFDAHYHTTPYIADWMLEEIFGPHTNHVRTHYLEPLTDNTGRYRMRPEADTQRKVEALFEGKQSADDIWIRDGLYSLISNVLFVADKTTPHAYHPRISAQHDYFYKSLPQWEKDAYNRLYDMYFYHRHNEFWRVQAMKKLPQLTRSTRMLVCGEDLGMIPDSVPWVMRDLRILSLEIQRMPKDPTQEFGNPAQYPYSSVCTISTHDMSTLRGWWLEDPSQTQRFYNSMMHHYGSAPAEASPQLCEEVIKSHLASASLLCIPSLQDWLSIDGTLRAPDAVAERINVPANPRHYWRWRMHLTIEQLIGAHELNARISKLISESGRAPEK